MTRAKLVGLCSETQKKIHEEVEGLLSWVEKRKSLSGQSWSKYLGDRCVRIFKAHIKNQLKQSTSAKNYRVSEPNAYIFDYPTEFDILIVDENAPPEKHSNAYKPEFVRIILEIKARGLYGGRKALEEQTKRMKEDIEKITQHHHIKFVYLTYQERIEPIRKGSIRYLDETENGLKPYGVFCLRDSVERERAYKRRNGEWESFSKHLMDLLTKGTKRAGH